MLGGGGGVFVAIFYGFWGVWLENRIPVFPVLFPAEISALLVMQYAPVLVEKYLDVRFLLASATVKMQVMYR